YTATAIGHTRQTVKYPADVPDATTSASAPRQVTPVPPPPTPPASPAYRDPFKRARPQHALPPSPTHPRPEPRHRREPSASQPTLLEPLPQGTVARLPRQPPAPHHVP